MEIDFFVLKDLSAETKKVKMSTKYSQTMPQYNDLVIEPIEGFAIMGLSSNFWKLIQSSYGVQPLFALKKLQSNFLKSKIRFSKREMIFN